MNTTRITLNPADTVATINPNIYGHFAEHLGRCIYDGIWVGEDSPIPNIDGFRTDIIEALRRINHLSFAGQAAALLTIITGRMASVRATSGRAGSTFTGAKWWKPTRSAHRNSSASAGWWGRSRISAEMLARVQCVSCATGLNTAISPIPAQWLLLGATARRGWQP